MKRCTSTTTLLLVFVLVASARLHAQHISGSPFRIERVSASLWRVTAQHEGPRIVRMPGEPAYSAVLMPGYEQRVLPGLPALPVAFLSFALPPDGALAVKVLSVQEEQLTTSLAPFGGMEYASRPQTEWVETVPVTERNEYRNGGIRFSPVRVVAGGLRWARSITLEIRIDGAESALAATARSADRSFVNADDAGGWRIAAARSVATVTPFSAKRAGERYVVLRTPAQGMYRITAADLTALGVGVSAIDPRNFRLLSRGVEIPVRVRGEEDGSFDGGDALEFYAARKQGDEGEYFDEWSDDNVFLLEWGDVRGLRGGSEDVAPATWPQAQLIDALPAILRLEEDREYHRGDFEYTDMQYSDRVPGETWMWTYLLKKDSLRIPFSLQQPGADNAALEFRVKGASRDPSLLRLLLNDVVVFEDTLGSYDTTRQRVSLPGGVLRDGANTLVFLNVGLVDCPPENPACSIERIYVDWAELRYQRSVTPLDGVLDVDASLGTGPALPVRALLRVRAASLRGVNIDTGDELNGIDVSAGVAAMAISGESRYHLFTGEANTPQLELREYKDLADPLRQADYIVITHPAFAAQARRLADYRAQSDGYSTIVADVNDIYAEFNDGHKHPSAIKAFLRNAYDAWSEPRPRFVLLMGDASWDAKFRKASSTRADYIPTYGNPASDNYFVRFADRSFDPTPFIPIGRIPAETPSDADAVIDKIIEYEALPPQPHDNRYLFSVGGESAFEQDLQLKPIAEALILNYVEPFCLEPRRIYKRTLTTVSYDDLDTLIHEVNQGVTWFLFAGHGGTRVIDVGIERPDIFSNKGKYPFFATISCNTAHFAEPFETGLNERFVLAKEHGSIASFGTAGLGIINYGYIMSRAMFRAMTDSGVRTFGELVHKGKLGLIAHYGPGDINTIHSADQHCLLGDPATRVPLARGPELLVQTSDILTDPEIITEQQRTRITTTVRNAGMCMADSVTVRLRVIAGGQEQHSATRRIEAFAVSAVLDWEYDFAGVDGEVSIEVTVDADNEIAELREDNNTATLKKSVLPRGIAQIFPLDNAVLAPGTDVTFMLANPSYVPTAGDPAVELEISSSSDFSTDMRRFSTPVDEVYTSLNASGLSADRVLYWRARMSTAGAADVWSATRSFRLETPPAPETWRQDAPAQLATNAVDALRRDGDGSYQLGSRPVQLEVTSGGFNGPFRFAILRVDDVDHSPNQRGFNCAVVEPRFGDVIAAENFDTYLNTGETQRMIDFVRTVPDDHILMIAVLDDANGWPPVSPNGSNILPELKAELKRFGASLIDSVSYRDSYGFIGSRARPSEAREMHFVLGTVLFADTLVVQAREGRFTTQRIGPANIATALGWRGELPHDSARVDLTLLGRSSDGRDTVFAALKNVQPGTPLDLGVLDCTAAPFLRVEGRMQDLNGAGSPVFRGLEVRYVSEFPEIGVTSQVVRLDADSVLEGGSIAVDVRVRNSGRASAGPFDVGLRAAGGAAAVPVRVAAIAPGGAADVELQLPTTGLRGRHSYELTVDAGNAVTEYYRANNAYSGTFVSGRDGKSPVLDVLFDGAPIVNNDYVRPRPEISIVLRDASPLPVTDTTAMQVFLDGRRVWLLSDPAVRYTAPTNGEEKVQVLYTPELKDGLHFLAVSGKDATGNAADTIPYQVRFYVSSTARIDQVLPWPSPTRGPVDFTYRCAGTDAPEAAEVRIYTVAGRLIRRIEAESGDLRIGFNRIAWDGRDQDGDAIANGVYFYKLSVTQQGAASEHVGRFSVLR
ncbi:MAG: C25 family cysteine peptidase [Bacteroidia bacterium]|nr:C25 family cysteine peptidase [Bacteroidia bacterium]